MTLLPAGLNTWHAQQETERTVSLTFRHVVLCILADLAFRVSARHSGVYINVACNLLKGYANANCRNH